MYPLKIVGFRLHRRHAADMAVSSFRVVEQLDEIENVGPGIVPGGIDPALGTEVFRGAFLVYYLDRPEVRAIARSGCCLQRGCRTDACEGSADSQVSLQLFIDDLGDGFVAFIVQVASRA